MTDKAGGKGEAKDATVQVVSEPDLDAQERAARKIQTAVDYQQRVLASAIANEEAADLALERAEAAVAAAEAGQVKAAKQREAAEAELEAAEEAAAAAEGTV